MEYEFYHIAIGVDGNSNSSMMKDLNEYARLGWRVIYTTSHLESGNMHYFYTLERDINAYFNSDLTDLREIKAT